MLSYPLLLQSSKQFPGSPFFKKKDGKSGCGNQVAEGPCWESGMRSAPGRPDPLAGELERAGPGDSGHSSAGLTFGHVAREPTRHVATVQRKVLPPGGPGGATQRARSRPHGAWSPSSVHRGGPLPRRTRPPSRDPARGFRAPAVLARAARAHNAASGSSRRPGGGARAGPGQVCEPIWGPRRPRASRAFTGF